MWACRFDNETSFASCENKDFGLRNCIFHTDSKESISIVSVYFSLRV